MLKTSEAAFEKRLLSIALSLLPCRWTGAISVRDTIRISHSKRYLNTKRMLEHEINVNFEIVFYSKFQSVWKKDVLFSNRQSTILGVLLRQKCNHVAMINLKRIVFINFVSIHKRAFFASNSNKINFLVRFQYKNRLPYKHTKSMKIANSKVLSSELPFVELSVINIFAPLLVCLILNLAEKIQAGQKNKLDANTH
jgi:hypothetical protein